MTMNAKGIEELISSVERAEQHAASDTPVQHEVSPLRLIACREAARDQNWRLVARSLVRLKWFVQNGFSVLADKEFEHLLGLLAEGRMAEA